MAAAAVDQHAEEYAAGPAEVGALVERRAHRAARVEHVVHDDDRAAVEVGKHRLAHHRPGADGLQVVAIESDVELAGGDAGAFGLIDQALEPVGQLHAAALDADQHEVLGATPPFDDLGSHARQRSAERAVVEKRRPGGHRGGKLVVQPRAR